MPTEIHVANRRYLAAVLKLVFAPLVFLIDIIANTYYWYFQDSFLDTNKKGVLITGCDSGFGKEAATLFASRGANVFAGCLTDEGVDALSSDLIKPFKLDITDEASMLNALEVVQDGCKKNNLTFWGVVSNAGIALAPGPVDWFTYDEFFKVTDINMLGHIRTVITFLPLIKKSKGRVVIMSSVAGHLAGPGMASYCASKFGVLGFADCLRGDMAKKGVHVSSIAPEFYPTNIINSVDRARAQWNKLSKELKEEYPFAELEQRYEKGARDIRKMASENKVSEVAEAYYSAMFGVHPRLTYFLGKKVGFYQFIKTLPDYLLAFVGSKMAD